METIIEKKCHGCGIIKPLAEFSLCKSNKDGHQFKCKTCYTTIPREYILRTEKVCTTCGELKPIDDYNLRKLSPDGHFPNCKACVGKEHEEYRQRNILLNDGARIETLENSDVTKRCTGCKSVKPLRDFSVSRGFADGHMMRCKDCDSTRKKTAWEDRKKLPKEQYETWWKKDNQSHKEGKRRLKTEVFTHYCHGETPKCANPFHIHNDEITDLDLLSLDHINGDGHLEVDKFGKRFGGIHFYRWLKLNGYPEKQLQVLCFNCQMKKAVLNNEHNLNDD